MHRNRLQSLNRSSQEGVVIVMALFIVALVTAMAYTMMSRLMRDTERTSLIVRNHQAELYGQGSVLWARDQLFNDWKNRQQNKVMDAIPIQSPVNNMNGYQIKSTIYDASGLFNINSLGNTFTQPVFQRLLILAVPGMQPQQAEAIMKAAVDWISANAQQNEYSRYYAALPTPYQTPHHLMVDVSELRLVKGMTPAIYTAIKPYITALPIPTALNVQTAPAILLAALSPNLTLEAARTIERDRVKKPFTTLEAFQALDIVTNARVPKDGVAVESYYFLVETEVTIEKQRIVLYTLLERVPKDDSMQVNVIWQSKGAK